MSDAASDEPVHTAHDGVSVEKRFEPEDFPVPAIAFTITSEREEAVSVRVADTIPEDIPTEDIGFHPKYGAEFWDVEGNTIVFTREFEPNEEYVTVYGLRGKDAAEVDRFLTEPEVTSVNPIEGASGEVVRDVIDDDGGPGADDATDDSGTEPDTSAADGDDDGDLDIDLPDPEDEAAADAGAADDTGPAGDTGATATAGAAAATEPAVAEGESLVAALVSEVESGRVADDDLEELREALGVTADDSTEARIEHLQSSVADLEAYTDALEAFLDEEGDAQSVLEDVQSDLEDAADRIEALEADVERIHEDVTDDLDEELASIRSELEAMDEDLAGVSEDRLDELEADLEALEAEIEDVAEMRDRLASALGGIAGTGAPGDSGDDDADDVSDDQAETDGGSDDGPVPDEPELDLED